ncbi:hypothetical protein IW150_005710, partial [Coemansia sp. RSA 2607]
RRRIRRPPAHARRPASGRSRRTARSSGVPQPSADAAERPCRRLRHAPRRTHVPQRLRLQLPVRVAPADNL